MYKITISTRTLDKHDDLRELNFNLAARYMRWEVWLESPDGPDKILARAMLGGRPDCMVWAAEHIQEELENREDGGVLLDCEPFLVGDSFRPSAPRPFTTPRYEEYECID